jgi:hypothetical protein
MVSSDTESPNSSCSRMIRSLARQRTTPWAAGIGPSSTILRRKALCMSSSLGGAPGEGMFDSGIPRESPNRSVGIIRNRVQLEKIAETLVPQMAQKAREIGISANVVRAQNPRAGRLNQVDPSLASITSSSVRNPVRGALTSTAMLPGGCLLVRINSWACGILVQGNTSLMQGSTRRSSTN